jgi:hypothetical protein
MVALHRAAIGQYKRAQKEPRRNVEDRKKLGWLAAKDRASVPLTLVLGGSFRTGADGLLRFLIDPRLTTVFFKADYRQGAAGLGWRARRSALVLTGVQPEFRRRFKARACDSQRRASRRSFNDFFLE